MPVFDTPPQLGIGIPLRDDRSQRFVGVQAEFKTTGGFMKFRGITLAASVLARGVAQAGPCTDDVSTCPVGKSTKDDHVILVSRFLW
jgi:hypothetical protein